jgi:hypothetical protein
MGAQSADYRLAPFTTTADIAPRPITVAAASTHAFGATVAVEDIYGNTVTSDHSNVTLTLGAATSGDGSVDGPDGAALGRYINGMTVPQMPTYSGSPVNELSLAGPSVSVLPPLQLGGGETVTVPATVAGASPADLTTRVVASAADSAIAASPASAAGVSRRGNAPAGGGPKGTVPFLWRPATKIGTVSMLQQLADELFAALARGPVDADESAVLGSIAGSVLGQASTAEASEAGSAQADLERFLWESGDSSWSDGDGQRLF